MDAFVCGSGTGGTLAGVSSLLKQRSPTTKVFLVDPPGSSLYNKVRSQPVNPFQPKLAETSVRSPESH